MSGNMSRNKGQRGEREVIKLIQPVIDRVYQEFGKEPPSLERNLMQTNKGGFDIIGLDWLALEVKYQEAEHIEQWWAQTVRQASNPSGQIVKEPILIYRRNKVKWSVMMFVHVPAGNVAYKCRATVTLESFLGWLYFRIRSAQEFRSA